MSDNIEKSPNYSIIDKLYKMHIYHNIKAIFDNAYKQGFEQGYQYAQRVNFNSNHDNYVEPGMQPGYEIINDLGEKLLILKVNSDGSLKCINYYSELSSLVEGSVTIIHPDDLDNWKPTGKKFDTNINEI